MSQKKASYGVRFSRLCRLLAWLFRTGCHLRKLDGHHPDKRNQAVLALGREALAALDIELTVNMPSEHKPITGALVASNHISWLDIFAMSAVYPSSFIAKQEISHWPVLGKMGKNAGTVFINRNSRRDIEPINQAIGEALKAGQNVSFFPESRTSSGREVLPLKAALFQSALDAQAPIQFMVLRYYDAEGQRSTEPSYANVNLPISLWRIVSMKNIRIVIDFAPLLTADAYQDKDRYMIKDMAEYFIKTKVAEDIS